MTRHRDRSRMPLASALAIAALLAFGPANAQERKPVSGTSVSLAPPKGFEAATDFAGLVNKTTQGSVLVVEMPAEAYEQLSSLFADANAAKAGFAKQNVTIAKREQIDVGGAKVPLLVGSQVAPNGVDFDKWIALLKGEKTVMLTVQSPKSAKLSQSDVKAMLASVSLGKEPTLEAKLAALPFSLKPAAPFRVIDTVLGSGAMMTVGDKNIDPEGAQPLMVVAHQVAAAVRPGQEEQLSETLLKGTHNLEDATIAERRHASFADGDGMVLRGTFKSRNGADKAFIQYLGIGKDGRFVRLIAMLDESRLAELQPAIEQTAASIAFTPK